MYDERCLKIIGANIKLLRTCRGISQGELARALVISQTHLSNIECCRVAVNFRVLLRAANALECTLDDLLQLEFTELMKTVMEVREYFSAQDGYALNVTGKLVIKEKSPFLFPLLAHSWQICSFPPFLSALRDRRLFVYRFGVIFGDFPRCMPLEKSAWYYRRG